MKRFSQLTQTASEADLVAGNFLAIDVPGVGGATKKLNSTTLLTKTAQNALAGNMAPAFDPTKPNDAGGYAYYAGEIVAYNGATYKFKVNHSSGAWNSAEVDRYDAGESLKFFVVTDNPEYLYAITDVNGVFLFGIRKDGSVEWQKGVPEIIEESLFGKVDKETGKSLIDSVFANGISVVTSDEFVYAVVDSAEKFIFGVDKSGDIVFSKGVPNQVKDFVCSLLLGKVDKEAGKSLIDSVFAESSSSDELQEFIKCITDVSGKLLEALDKDGGHIFFRKVVFNGGIDWSDENLTDLSRLLKEKGLSGGTGDWSDKKELSIPKPKCAAINFSNIANFPSTKTADLQAILEFWDMEGNYFKKKVILNAQGNSTLAFPKRNLSIDLCNDDWVGDDTFKLKIGDWLPFDSFHIKAFYNDFFKGLGEILYDVADEVFKSRGVLADAPWKKSIGDVVESVGRHSQVSGNVSIKNRMDNGALCHPMAFPCVVFLNGSFNGIYQFQIKKDRDNYAMKKSTASNIHIDGYFLPYLFGANGSIDWTKFEVRNPKGLKDVDGNKYDGDNPKELSDTDSFSHDVKLKIEALSSAVANIHTIADNEGVESQELKEAFESLYDIDNLIDCVCFFDFTANTDCWDSNTQWITYDGVKWYASVYDLDNCIGFTANASGGGRFRDPSIGAVHYNSKDLPWYYLFQRQEYLQMVEARYAELRSAGILSVENIVNKVNNMMKYIGYDVFKDEEEKWPDSLGNSDSVVDEHWELATDGEGNYIFGNTSSYVNTQNYSVNDEVYYGDNAYCGIYKFVCVAPVVGKPPFARKAVRDSLWRLRNWLTAHTYAVDSDYNFNT